MRPTPRAPACLLAVLLGAVTSSAFDADYHKHELAIAAEQGSMESVVRLLDAGEDLSTADGLSVAVFVFPTLPRLYL